MYRSVLFTGCAADRDGAPSVHQATIALARALRLELWEAPASGCCGARPDRAVSAAELRHALAPLGEGAHQGLDIVCLSPACRCVVATHMVTGDEHAAGSDMSASTGSESPVPPTPQAPRVHDIIHVLTQADGLERLGRAVVNPLSPLRIALHTTCHADHQPTPPAQPRTAHRAPGLPATRKHPAWLARAVQWTRQPAAIVSDTGAAHVAQTGAAYPATAPRQAPTGLADLIATTGAMALPDVSMAGRCAMVHLRHDWIRPAPGAAPDVRCLALAAQNSADLLVTSCFLCFSDLNHYQRTLDRADPARGIPVLHLSQVLGVACGVAPLRLDLTRTTASARRVLAPFVA